MKLFITVLGKGTCAPVASPFKSKGSSALSCTLVPASLLTDTVQYS